MRAWAAQVSDLLQALASYQRTSGVGLEVLFERFDTNGDGRLQPNELNAFVTAVLGRATPRQHRYLQVRGPAGSLAHSLRGPCCPRHPTHAHPRRPIAATTRTHR